MKDYSIRESWSELQTTLDVVATPLCAEKKKKCWNWNQIKLRSVAKSQRELLSIETCDLLKGTTVECIMGEHYSCMCHSRSSSSFYYRPRAFLALFAQENESGHLSLCLWRNVIKHARAHMHAHVATTQRAMWPWALRSLNKKQQAQRNATDATFMTSLLVPRSGQLS